MATKIRIKIRYTESGRFKYDKVEVSRTVGDWAVHQTYYSRSGFQITHVPSGFKVYPHSVFNNQDERITYNRAYSIACKLSKMKTRWSGRGVPSEKFLEIIKRTINGSEDGE